MLAVVGCGASKVEVPAPAADLYTGALFRLSYEVARAAATRVWIASARYGLLEPDRVVAPYDLRLGQLRPADRLRWGEHAAVALSGHARGADLVLLMGQEYLRALLPALRRVSPSTTTWEPLRGLPIGRRLVWLRAARSLSVDELQQRLLTRRTET